MMRWPLPATVTCLVACTPLHADDVGFACTATRSCEGGICEASDIEFNILNATIARPVVPNISVEFTDLSVPVGVSDIDIFTEDARETIMITYTSRDLSPELSLSVFDRGSVPLDAELALHANTTPRTLTATCTPFGLPS